MKKYDLGLTIQPGTLAEKLFQRITPTSRVLEFGCAYGRMTKYLKENLHCKVSVIELDEDAYAVAREYAEDGFCGNIDQDPWYAHFDGQVFDCILFMDVLEHLKYPQVTLSQVKSLLSDDGEIIISLPNIAHSDILRNLYLNKFSYTELGILDNTHIHFWGAKDIPQFVHQAGYEMVVLDGVYLPSYHTEQVIEKGALPNELDTMLSTREYGELYQFFIVMQKKEWTQNHGIVFENKLSKSCVEMSSYFFFDIGEGYQPDLYIFLTPTLLQNRILQYECRNIPSGCKKVRYDPTLNHCCFVTDVFVNTNIGSCHVYPLNGTNVQNIYVFANTEPQMEFLFPEGAKWFSVSVKLQTFDRPEYYEIFTAIQQLPVYERDRQDLLQAQDQKEQVCQTLQNHITDITLQYEMAAQECQTFQKQLASLNTQYVQATQENQSFQEQIAVLNAQYEHAAQENRGFQEQIATLDVKCEQTAQTNQSLQDKIVALNTQYEQVVQECYAFQEQISILNSQHQMVAQENLSLMEQIDGYSAQREILKDHIQKNDLFIEELELHIRQTEDVYHALQLYTEQLQKQNAILLEQYQCIADSQCWKATKPIRMILDAIKRTGFGMLLHKTARSLRMFGLRVTLQKIREYRGAARIKAEVGCIAPETLFEMAAQMATMGADIYNQDRLQDLDVLSKKKILLVSHEMNLTGAPVALGYFAAAVQKQGYFPVIISPRSGALCGQLSKEHLPIFIYEGIYQTDFISSCVSLFDLIVVCTNVGAPLVAKLNGADIPVLWWIHEARVSYHPDAVAAMPEALADNVHVYCGGAYAQRVLKEYRPAYKSKQLLYYVPDYAEKLPAEPTFQLQYAEGKIIFAIVGMQEERKGQDLLVQAIRLLEQDVLKRCLFVFVGRAHYKPIQKEVFAIYEDYPLNVQYIEEMGREDLTSLYMQMDCLICASRDDPLPIVVTEAMLMSKVIICSENSGSADILDQMNAGLIYHHNDPVELAENIRFVCKNRGANLWPMCERAREAYEEYFSQEVFEQSLAKIIGDMLQKEDKLLTFDGAVSVVVPTYNAGSDIVTLLGSLWEQEGIGSVEIIVVDSESKDGTAELAEKLGATVIRIRQSEFSHSYARNLGAEKASGEYLLFMTQDALPNGTKWICGLMQPVLRQNAVAVSCRETPRPGCDLMGRVGIWCHSEYMGILERDRIIRMPVQQNYDSLRRNGQLNDVTCLVRRELFLQFKYRGDYAEDLDLGLRLIQSGYTLALLSSVQVVHSHTRPALYHIKRTVVDIKTLKSILPDMPIETITAQTAANRAVTAYCILAPYLQIAWSRSEESWDTFCQWSNQYFDQTRSQLLQMNQDNLGTIIRSVEQCFDRDIQGFVEELFIEYQDHLAVDIAAAKSLFYFLTHVVSRYFVSHDIQFNQEMRKEIVEMLPKYFGQLLGILLASYAISYPAENGLLHDMVQRYSEGI